MAHDVVDGLFEDQIDVASHVRPEPQILLKSLRLKAELNVATAENLARETSHAPGEVAQAVALRIDRPDDVAHRGHRLARYRGDGGEGAAVQLTLPAQSLPSDLTEDGDLGQV